MEIKETMKVNQEQRLTSSDKNIRSSQLRLKSTALKTLGYKQVEA